MARYTKELAMQIVKGQVADYACGVSRIQDVTNEELARILEEIAAQLKRNS
jgi:hypothetical protein